MNTRNKTKSKTMSRWSMIRAGGVLAAAVTLGACSNMSPQARDTAVGATAGAALGGLVTGNTTGAAVGAAVGGVVGSQATPRSSYNDDYYYDDRRRGRGHRHHHHH